MDADLIVHGLVLTMDAAPATAKAIAIGGDRILAVGTEAQADRWRGRGTTVWRLKPGRTVVPGFIDAHAHLAHDAWRRTWIDLGGCESLEAVLQVLRDCVATARHGEWIVGRGWDESTWPVKRYLNRHDLDRVSVSHPILVNRVDGHMCSVNSAVVARVDFGGNGAGVDRGADGSPTGVLKEESADLARAAIPVPTEEEWTKLLQAAIVHAHALGITSVHDFVEPAEMRAYQSLRRQGRLSMRAYLMPYADQLEALIASGLRTGFGDAWLRLGAVKLFADGSFGARTAALFDPYDDEARATGRLVHSPKELAATMERAHRAGFQVAVHAIGDRGVDVVVESFARAFDRDPSDDRRHRIEHAELGDEQMTGRVRDLRLILSMQPNFVARWSHPGGLYERRLGRERLERNNPYRGILDDKIPLAFGSDGMPYGPLFGLGGAVRAPLKGQRITANEALACYTKNGAYASFEDAEKGALTRGAFADFVVLSGDPRKGVRWTEGLAVEATVVGGNVVFGGRGS